jgi:hypothetical protein
MYSRVVERILSLKKKQFLIENYFNSPRHYMGKLIWSEQ